ncbi:glycoside hydrolase family 115 protein [Hygrophoropsis aurantiaca]|uniref:Glycoside hydrolase family 115 protein n=1 Tax=Hygrophoropsis aurantiaca TaxID=72124 RepID=A0ACB8ADS2_9AGAM|nr:glycoside hydrolase family 115 protein [Hygrophoropsis aurantiaca]
MSWFFPSSKTHQLIFSQLLLKTMQGQRRRARAASYHAHSGLSVLIARANALGQMRCVCFEPSSSSFPVVAGGQAAPVYFSSDDWLGVQFAATNFATDIERVTSQKPTLHNLTSLTDAIQPGAQPTIVGTLGQPSLIDQIVNATNLDVSSIGGQWGRSCKLCPILSQALIYMPCMTTLSNSVFRLDTGRQMCPQSQTSRSTYVDAITGLPTIKYRGIFPNDEQPALQNWATENAFGINDPPNQYYADTYGIVMSHQEPIMRSTPVECIFLELAPGTMPRTGRISTVSGWADVPDHECCAPPASYRRPENLKFLSDVNTRVDITTIPQMWCLLLAYYEERLVVPDDVTLLWADDPFGNTERFPHYDERNRSGGAGVYYLSCEPSIETYLTWKAHQENRIRLNTGLTLAQVGAMRDYEWITSSSSLTDGTPSSWAPITWMASSSEREFALSGPDSAAVAEIIANVARYNSRRKPEIPNATTYNLANYRDLCFSFCACVRPWKMCTHDADGGADFRAKIMLQEWDSVLNASAALYNSVSSAMKPAFFQLVQHPVEASHTNNLHASQARSLFQKDYDLKVEYHTILDARFKLSWFHANVTWARLGKWDHHTLTHVRHPKMPFIIWVQQREASIAGIMRIGYSCPNPIMTLDPYVPFQNRYVDVGAGGPIQFGFTVTSNASWLSIATTQGSASSFVSGAISLGAPEQRVFVSVSDWSQVEGVQTVVVNFNATTSAYSAAKVGEEMLSVLVTFVVNHTVLAEGFSAGAGPSVGYDFYNFNTLNQSGTVSITTYVAPSLNANGDDRPTAFAIQVDDEEPQTEHFIPPAAPDMDGFAATNIVPVMTNFTRAARSGWLNPRLSSRK